MKEAGVYTQYARQLHALQAYAAAVSAAEAALAHDPFSLLAAYYLSRDYYMTGKYKQAADLSLKLAAEISDPAFRANLYSNAGDALTSLRNFAEAKDAYRNSYRYDYVLNLRSLSALNGPGEDLQ